MALSDLTGSGIVTLCGAPHEKMALVHLHEAKTQEEASLSIVQTRAARPGALTICLGRTMSGRSMPTLGWLATSTSSLRDRHPKFEMPAFSGTCLNSRTNLCSWTCISTSPRFSRLGGAVAVIRHNWVAGLFLVFDVVALKQFDEFIPLSPLVMAATLAGTSGGQIRSEVRRLP